MFTRILIPLDGSEVAEQTLRYVRWLGRELGAPIELLRVVEPIPRELKDVTDAASLEKVESDLRSKSRDYLESVGGSLREDGLQVSCTVLEGQPAFQVVGLARKVPGTLIAMSTNGRTGMDWWLLGSVSALTKRTACSPKHPDFSIGELRDTKMQPSLERVLRPPGRTIPSWTPCVYNLVTRTAIAIRAL